MTHRDRAGDPSGQRAGRREAAGPAGHRQGFPTPPRAPAAGSPARPERRLPKAFGLPIAFRRGAWLAMPCIAAPRAPGRKPWEAVSMGHYQRDLVLIPRQVIRTQIALCPVRRPSWHLALVHMAAHKGRMVAPISAMYGFAPIPAHPPFRAILGEFQAGGMALQFVASFNPGFR